MYFSYASAIARQYPGNRIERIATPSPFASCSSCGDWFEHANDQEPWLDAGCPDSVGELPGIAGQAFDDVRVVERFGDEQNADAPVLSAVERAGEVYEPLIGQCLHEGCVIAD